MNSRNFELFRDNTPSMYQTDVLGNAFKPVYMRPSKITSIKTCRQAIQRNSKKKKKKKNEKRKIAQLLTFKKKKKNEKRKIAQLLTFKCVLIR